MNQNVLAPQQPKPPQTPAPDQGFAYRRGVSVAAQRALLQVGNGENTMLPPSYFQDQFGVPAGEVAMRTEFSDDFQSNRQFNFDSQVRNLDVFAWGESAVPIGPESYNLMRTTDKLRDIFKEPLIADKKFRHFLEIFAQDIGVSAYEAEWQAAVQSNPDRLRLSGNEMRADSLVAKVNFVYDLDPKEANRTATNNSRLRGERFVQNHGEAVTAAIAKFPELANDVLVSMGITDAQTLAAVQKRFEEVKHRVIATSYLERSMPADANGAYYGSSHAAFLNADFLVDATTEEVQHVVFHELWHAVSAQNNVDCKEAGSDETVEKRMGTGIPHATWLTEGVTDILARRTMQSLYKDKKVATGSYQHEVDIVTNIIESNPKIMQLLLNGNFEDMSAGQKPNELKTSRAVALIEKIYGSGFVQHAELTLDAYYKEPEQKASAKLAADIKQLKEYTKNPRLAKKALKVAGLAVAAFTVYAHGYNAIDKFQDMVQTQAESRVRAERPMVWQDTTPEQIQAIVELNTEQNVDARVGYAKGGFVEITDKDQVVGRYLDPVFLRDKAGEEYAGFMQDGVFTLQKLGPQPDGGRAMIAFNAEDGLVYPATPIVREGLLINEETGEPIGESATLSELQDHVDSNQ